MASPKSTKQEPEGVAGMPSDDKLKLFEGLIPAHQSQIRKYIRSIGVDSVSVDDIAQEAFIIAYDRFDSYKPEASFPAWVCSIARNLVWNDRRKATRRYKILNKTVTEFLSSRDPFEDMADSEDHEHRHTALRQCLEKLPEQSHKLIQMRYQQNMQSTKLAENYGIREDAIRQRLRSIRLALRDCIDSKLNEGNDEH